MTATPNGGVLGATVPTATFKGGITGGPVGSTGVGASTAGQPFGVPTNQYGTVPTGTGTGTTSLSGFQAPSISSGVSTTGGDNTTLGDFQQTYGKGTGTALEGVLAGLGTSTNAAVEATNAEVLQSAGIQQANMRAQQAASGISPDSSAAALASGDFAAQVNTSLQATDAQLENQGLDTLISSLTNEGKAHGTDLSAWDTFGDVLNAGAGIIGTGIGAMTGTASLGGILGGLSGSGGAGAAVDNSGMISDMG
jgi:hypothetical protein